MLGYLPLDGRLDRPDELRELSGFRCLLTYTETAASNLRSALAAAGNSTPVACLGHGVDTGRFKPSVEVAAADLQRRRMELAQAYFRLPEPAFVVLNAARPDPRKRIDLTLDAFARFACDRPPHVKLCLHQALGHREQVEPLRAQAAQLGIEQRIIWHPASPGPITDAELNRLYNACAVGINTAAGEGFGLVSFEHAAVGVPQVLPDQPALRELWGDAALRIAARPVRTPHSPLEMVEASVSEAADALAQLYDDPALYRRMAQTALARGTATELGWAPVGSALRNILRRART